MSDRRASGDRCAGQIASVAPGSVAEELGLEPGDLVLSVSPRKTRAENCTAGFPRSTVFRDQPIRDVLDFRFLTSSGEFTLLVERQGQETLYEAWLDEGEALGIEFAEAVFDGLRRCRNKCTFCFVQQLPAGLRPSLYIRDDDYRYSFLYGSFVTLTNLAAADWERLAEQRLSPLYISVHATEQGLRDSLLGIHEQPPLLERLAWLREHGIRFHTQIVLVPGVNDGTHMDRSLSDLLSLGEALLSVSVVPVGLTKYAPAALRPYKAEEAIAIIKQVGRWRRASRKTLGRASVYAADEWFLLAGVPVPSARYYEDFPQIENGVGLVRLFLDEWRAARRRAAREGVPSDARTVICGTLMAPIWQQVAEEMNALGGQVRVLPVVNRALGEAVSVSGLLFAEDVIAALHERGAGDTVYLPRAMFNAEGTITLDGYSPADLERDLGVPLLIAAEAAEVLAEHARACCAERATTVE